MIDKFVTGATAAAVAVEYGVSEQTVKRLLRKHGVRRTPKAA
ncbi:hypothetical protein [Crossiella sp. SN42]|nr:hypothetical protein [Crossiella sp. SN42]